MKIRKTTTIYNIIGIVAMFLGLLMYLMYRQETYISRVFFSFGLSFKSFENFSFLNCSFVKFYFVDYLWGLGLTCGLHSIFNPEIIGSLVCTIILSIIGFVYESMQYFGYIKGTGDIADVMLYILAGITVNIIIYLLRRNEK